MPYDEKVPDPDAVELTGDQEPPPEARSSVGGWTAGPVAFAAPPDEEIELAGDIPWELRDADEVDAASADGTDEAAGSAR